MALEDDQPTFDQRRPRRGIERFSGPGRVDVSASLDAFIGDACAVHEPPESVSPPEPASPPAPPDPIAMRMAEIEAALVRAASRVEALAELPPARRRRRGLVLTAASVATGALLAVVLLRVGWGPSPGESEASTAPPPVSGTAEPVAAPAPAPVAAPAPAPVAAPAPASATPSGTMVRRKPVRRPEIRSRGIVDPFPD